MSRWHRRRARIGAAVAWTAAALFATLPLRAQLEIFSIEPDAGRQGEEFPVILRGEGFDDGDEFEIVLGGVPVFDAHLVHEPGALVIAAHVVIPDDVLPGPRDVEVLLDRGGERFAAVLPGAFHVLRGAAPPAPTPPDEDRRRDAGRERRQENSDDPRPETGEPSFPWWWTLGAAIAALLTYVAGRLQQAHKASPPRPAATGAVQQARLRWQLEAESELPEPRETCTWTCQMRMRAEPGRRWHLRGLRLVPWPGAGHRRNGDHVAGRIVEQLDPALHRTIDEAEIERRIATVAEVLVAHIEVWRTEGESPAAVALEADLEGDVPITFILYHCEDAAGGPRWIEKDRWQGNLSQPAVELAGVVNGPAAGESEFARRAHDECTAFLKTLIAGVRRRL